MSYVTVGRGLDLHWLESKAAIRHCGQENAWLVGYLSGCKPKSLKNTEYTNKQSWSLRISSPTSKQLLLFLTCAAFSKEHRYLKHRPEGKPQSLQLKMPSVKEAILKHRSSSGAISQVPSYNYFSSQCVIKMSEIA